MDIIGKRKIYFLISLLIIIPGIISLAVYGLKLSIDFTGGSLLELEVKEADKALEKNELKKIVAEQNIEISSLAISGKNSFIIRMKPIDKEANNKIQQAFSQALNSEVKEVRFETVGPTIGKELTRKAVLAVIVASIAIIFYLAWAFRNLPKEISSWHFGAAAIIALIHDVLILVGTYSLLGHFFGVEIDALFITALLTVMGFSVHDSIVVFDRIRENLHRMGNAPFAQVVNESMIQTLGRSLTTSLTVLFTLFALILFTGESLRWFLVALLIGIITGTYSSIFNASPILVVWHQWKNK